MQKVHFSILLFLMITGCQSYLSKGLPIDRLSCSQGRQQIIREKYETAIELFSTCLTLDIPSSTRAAALENRAKAFSKLGRFQEAIVDAETALAIAEPKNVWPLISLATYHKKLKQYPQALEMLAKAKNYDEDGPGTGPGMAVGYHSGMVYQEMGDHKNAVKAFTAAIPKQPDYGWVYFKRALSYEKLGQKELAAQDMQAAYVYIPEKQYTEDEQLRAKFQEYDLL